ncbi:MAG TPA: aldehyde dehydrogenase family protein [Prolixibacteraceae bacterium]|nr:aldehyde dehydrogenase family protein [Prolixibacteraceae bacterium]
MSIEEIMQQAVLAAAEYSQFDQSGTDAIVKAVFEAAFDQRIRLAKMANQETGIGKWEDKVIKNVLASQIVYEDIKDQKTVGIINDDKETGIVEIAQPMGPILAIIPVTNPTSTTLFKILIALKARNPIIICPSKKAVNCCSETAEICYRAALAAGAPEGCIQWLTTVTREQTAALMSHPSMALILATGGPGLVKSAYSSGTPAIGVGAGNVPVFIEASADIRFAVDQILESKTFDNGTVCASEQAVIVEKAIATEVKEEFRKQGAKILNPDETLRLTRIAVDPQTGLMNPDIVGKPVQLIAELAGIAVDDGIRLLVAPLDGVGSDFPLSSEVLAPIIGYYEVANFESGLRTCIRLNYNGGVGHSASIFSNDEEKILYFSMHMNAGRIVVNTPSSQGAVGAIYNRLSPSLTLGCGTGGKNITTDNVTAKHLINILRIARRRPNQRFAAIDKSLYFNEEVNADIIQKKYNHNV